MARKTANEDDQSTPPPKRPIQTSVGGYPAYTKGNNGVIDTNTSELRKKPAGAKKVAQKIHPTESVSDDDFMPETLCGKARGKAKKLSAPETESSESSENEPDETEDGKKGFKDVVSNEAVKTLTDQQKVAVGSMVLDGMLHLEITYVPTQFATWLLEAFDSKTCKLVTPRGDAEILPKDVNFTLELPMGGRPIKFPLRSIHDALLVQTFRRQYGDPLNNKIKCKEVSEKIKKSKEADDLFKLNFLVLFYSTMVDSTKSRKANQRILNAIEGIDDIRALNWGEFMIERLQHTKDEWEIKKEVHTPALCHS
ncbi:hypothetical protein QQ045_022087 [Rhodiola kirilowii]